MLTPWFPFTKNFSSRESVLFIHDSVIISPLELFIILTFLSWFGRILGRRQLTLKPNPLTWPVVIFLLFILFGMAYGIATGGNVNIALWEARPHFYLVALIFLSGNLLEKREHIENIMWAAIIGISFEAIFGTLFFFVQLKGSLAGVNALTDHPAAIHMNTILVFALASWFYKTKPGMRFGLTWVVPFVLITTLANQRRAAIVSLFIALLLMSIILFRDNRRLFWIIMPPLVFITAVYMVAFWNNSGALGLPARAIKSTLFENQASARDQSSNYYRVLENINTSFTFHQKPLTGVGFGQKFYVVVPMADISIFEWWQYIPHNSIIWMWLKTGVGGFIAILYLMGSTIMLGVRAYLCMPFNEMRAIALASTLYLVMQFSFAYVDMSWDTQSMLYLGMVIGLLCSIERIVATPVPDLTKRWPWQPDPTYSPELIYR